MITQRLNEYIQYKGLSYYKVEKTLKVSTGSISGAIKRRRSIGSKILQRILLVYPDLSAEWLLRGEGKMLIDERSGTEINNLGYETLTNDWLIDRILLFFNLKSKNELVSFFERIWGEPLSEESEPNKISRFEKTVLEIVEKKYGGVLSNAEELYALYLKQMMREGEDMLEKRPTEKGKENSC